MRKDAFSTGFSGALGAAVLALLLYLLWRLLGAVAEIATPFVGGIVLALMLDPLVTRLQAKVTRGSRGRALAIVFLLFLVFFAGLFTFVVPNLVEQTQRLVRWFSPVTYTVRRSTVSPGEDEPRYVTVVDGLSSNAFTVKRLVNGVTYKFVVLAVNADGGGVPSDPVAVTPSEDQPETPRGVPADETEPRVAASPSPEPAPSPSPAAVPEPGASPAPGAPPGDPAAPTFANAFPRDLTAIAGDGEVRLTWKAPTAGQSGFDQLRAQVDRWLTGHRRIGPIKLPENLESITAQYSDQVAQFLKTSAGRAGEVVLGSVARLLDIVLVPIIAAYLLIDLDRLRARSLFLLPERWRGHVLTTAQEVGGVFGNYVRGLVTICALYGASCMAGLFALSIWFPSIRGYALLLGFAAGVLYAVPYLGALGTAALAVIAAVSTGGGVPAAVASLVVLLALNQLYDNYLMPKIVGGEVGLHPLLSLFALILGGKMFGLWGMLLSVPVAASIQVVLFRLFPRLAAPTPLALMLADSEERIARRQLALEEREERERQTRERAQAAAEEERESEPPADV